jgi:hypothetical protein
MCVALHLTSKTTHEREAKSKRDEGKDDKTRVTRAVVRPITTTQLQVVIFLYALLTRIVVIIGLYAWCFELREIRDGGIDGQRSQVSPDVVFLIQIGQKYRVSFEIQQCILGFPKMRFFTVLHLFVIRTTALFDNCLQTKCHLIIPIKTSRC